MMDYREIEKLLVKRPEGWWNEVVAHLPELEPMADQGRSEVGPS